MCDCVSYYAHKCHSELLVVGKQLGQVNFLLLPCVFLRITSSQVGSNHVYLLAHLASPHSHS